MAKGPRGGTATGGTATGGTATAAQGEAKMLTSEEIDALEAQFDADLKSGGDYAWKDGETIFGTFQGFQRPPDRVVEAAKKSGIKKVSDLVAFADARTGEIIERWAFGLLRWHIETAENFGEGDLVKILYQGKDDSGFHKCRVSSSKTLNK